MIFIGDVAGQYEALVKLVRKLPDDQKIVLLGDLVDRGPDSKKVVQWAIDNQDKGVTTLKGNHEDMMIDWVDNMLKDGYESRWEYEGGIWIENGGDFTMFSYGGHGVTRVQCAELMREHVEWLRKCPTHIMQATERPFWYASHAPNGGYQPEDFKFLWNRHAPKHEENYFQVYGHNAGYEVEWIENHDGYKYAACIDTSRSRKLTALEMPTLKIYEQSY